MGVPSVPAAGGMRQAGVCPRPAAARYHDTMTVSIEYVLNCIRAETRAPAVMKAAV